ncbi:hypothetical protein EG327_002898 [Venturia inaequalis]|uniref:Uncharacterized protein n=1 Tax=Venturia inaequalis TaxID=5025 RepID=A0A8H3VJT2_VENIN|nr:hypothetical protein EG327_002898 [Venturia inaequalis]
MACPDTGSSINAITIDLALQHNLFIEHGDDHLPMKVQATNGNWLSPCGHIRASCSVDGTGPYSSIIYVFRHLTDPGLLFGRAFLDKSKAFTAKLLKEIPRWPSIPAVRSIGCPSVLLSCSLDGKSVGASPDSGSDVNLISRDYAVKHFKIEPASGSEMIQYVDDSIERISGIVRAELIVGAEPPDYEGSEDDTDLVSPTNIAPVSVAMPKEEATPPKLMKHVVRGEFWVVESLPANILIGLDSLIALAAYERNPDEFYLNFEQTGERDSINRILDVSGTVCGMVGGARHFFRRPSSARPRARADDIEAQIATITSQRTRTVDMQDQRENARREVEDERVAWLEGQAKEDAVRAEIERRREYNEDRFQRHRAAGSLQSVEQQGFEQQGVEQHGVEQQGVEQQGVEQQGVEQQGVEQQGVEQQGVEQQGVEREGDSELSLHRTCERRQILWRSKVTC